jgi:aminocarboxymuconate-semialdehyde decarboxylase
VALGSDYPFPLGEDRPGSVLERVAGLTGEERDQVLWGAARSFLGMAP